MRRRRGKRARAAVTALALGGAPFAALPVAHADDAGHVRAALDYALPDGAPTCPDRDTFASAVSTRLGYDPFAGGAGPADAAPKTLIVRFRREKSAIIALLRLGDAEKSLVSETGACDELGAAAAFAAAILLDPRVMFPRPPAPAPTGGASLNSNSPGTWPWYEPPPTLPPEAPKPAAPAPPLKLRAGIAATGCAGCGPAPNVGATVFFGVARERLGLDVGARADLATSAQADGGHDVSSSLLVGELFPHFRVGPARLGVLGQLGALFGDSEGAKQTSVWGGAGARGGFAFPLFGPVFLHAALDGLVVIARVSLRVAGREVWSSPGFVGGLSLGGGVEF